MNKKKMKPLVGNATPVGGSGRQLIRHGDKLVVQDMGNVIDTYQPASYNLGYMVWEYTPTDDSWEILHSVYEYTEASGYNITP